MPKPVAEVGGGQEDASGNGVYCFIRDLIVEGRDARFVDKKGRYVINWSRALKCYHDYKSKRNPQYKSKNINRRKASNGLRAALLNFYKKEGAKEYKDCKKVNEKDEVVERQFQMPPRVFASLFGSNLQFPDDSSEHETSSIASEADEKPLATPNSSDTGFDEAMDIFEDPLDADAEPSSHCTLGGLGGLATGDPLCSNIKTEEDQVDPSDITTPCQMFDISEEELNLALGEICSNSDTNDIDLLGVVHDICPSSGSVKGGLQFYISLTEVLSEDDKSGIAHFDGIGDVSLERLNCYTLFGSIPASQQPGPVPVTVNTQDGRLLGMTCFLYVDETLEVLKQLVNDPALQSLYFAMRSKQHGLFGSDGNLAQNLGPFTLQDQGSSIRGTHAQALKVLQLLVYTAAQTNAQQFIQMIFSTSAGKLVFNSYKDRPQLPEDVARASGHDDLAQYLQDVNTRLSKESGSDDKPNAIDWLELIEAVNKIQKQSSVVEDETDLESGQPKDDDNQSDYFADAETSSCGSFDREIGWSDSEDGEGPCPKDGGSNKDPDVRSAPFMNATLCEELAEMETQSDNDLDLEDDTNHGEPAMINSKPTLNLPSGMSRQLMKLRKGDTVTSTQRGVCYKEVRAVQFIGQPTGGETQKRENTSEREQQARAYLGREKCVQLKSPSSKDERLKKVPDERLPPSMEGTSSEAPTVSGTNLIDNEVDQQDDGTSYRKSSIILCGETGCGKSRLMNELLKERVAASGREEEARTVPSQGKPTKLKSPSSKDERTRKEPDERLPPSMEGTSSEAPTVSGTNLIDNEVDQKDDGTSLFIPLLGKTGFGKSTLINKLLKKRVAASGREEEARTAPSQGKPTKLKSPSSKDERTRKEPDERLPPSMEGTSSEAPTVSGTNLIDNEVDQKDDGTSLTITLLGKTGFGKSTLINELLKERVAASGREEEARTAPSQGKPTKLKSTRKWLNVDDVTTSSQQGACVNKTQEVRSFGAGIFQRVTGGGTQKKENISDRKQEARTGPSQPKRRNQSCHWWPFRTALLITFFLLITALVVLCLVAGIKLKDATPIEINGSQNGLQCADCSSCGEPIIYATPCEINGSQSQNGLQCADCWQYREPSSNVRTNGSQNGQSCSPVWEGYQQLRFRLLLFQRHGSKTSAKCSDSSSHLSCILCSTKLATNGRPKGSERKISLSFGVVDKCIKNGTNKVLLRSELPLKEIPHEGHHLVNATELVLLTLIIYIVLCIGLYTRTARCRCAFHRQLQSLNSIPSSTKTTRSSSDATACETNGSQNGQSCSASREGCEDEIDKCSSISYFTGKASAKPSSMPHALLVFIILAVTLSAFTERSGRDDPGRRLQLEDSMPYCTTRTCLYRCGCAYEAYRSQNWICCSARCSFICNITGETSAKPSSNSTACETCGSLNGQCCPPLRELFEDDIDECYLFFHLHGSKTSAKPSSNATAYEICRSQSGQYCSCVREGFEDEIDECSLLANVNDMEGKRLQNQVQTRRRTKQTNHKMGDTARPFGKAAKMRPTIVVERHGSQTSAKASSR